MAVMFSFVEFRVPDFMVYFSTRAGITYAAKGEIQIFIEEGLPRYCHEEKSRNWLSQELSGVQFPAVWVQLRRTRGIISDSDLQDINKGYKQGIALCQQPERQRRPVAGRGHPLTIRRPRQARRHRARSKRTGFKALPNPVG